MKRGMDLKKGKLWFSALCLLLAVAMRVVPESAVRALSEAASQSVLPRLQQTEALVSSTEETATTASSAADGEVRPTKESSVSYRDGILPAQTVPTVAATPPSTADSSLFHETEPAASAQAALPEQTQGTEPSDSETGKAAPQPSYSVRTARPAVLPQTTPVQQTQGIQETQASSPNFSLLPFLGLTIGVDAGHGGYDAGCLGKHMLEKDVNLSVALSLRTVLEKMGATVVMTRTADLALLDDSVTEQKKRTELTNRLNVLRDGQADLLLSIHMNHYEDSRVHGAQVFYRDGSTQGRKLAEAVRAGMREGGITLHGNTSLVGDFYMLSTLDAAVLIECGFLSNEEEEALLVSPAYQEKLALSIAKGVQSYLQRM